MNHIETTKYHIIIPSRLASTRLPKKALLDIEGKPMVQRVYERALLCGAESVTVATDHPSIEAAIHSIGGNVCMTKPTHRNGTERLAEAVLSLNLPKEDIVINIQGDEPLFPIDAIQPLLQGLIEDQHVGMSTLAVPIQDPAEIHNPNIVKVVLDKHNNAIYFSRAPIPWHRDKKVSESWSCLRHIGLYAYRMSTLAHFLASGPSLLEDIEGIEPLRILWQGGKIRVKTFSKVPPPSVDVESDLLAIRSIHRNLELV